LAKPAQLQIWDLRDEHREPLFPVPGVVRLEPVSTRELVDSVPKAADPFTERGKQVSGRQRERMQEELWEALIEFYVAARALYDQETAAALLLRMCARDPSFEPSEWLVELWDDYRDDMRERFHGAADDGRTDWAEGKGEDEEGEDDE
jgi:hypothetical protein